MTHGTDYHNDYTGVFDGFADVRLLRDMQTLLCGERIGYGSTRTVYQFYPNDALVLKIEQGFQSFANIIEWETWQYFKNTPLSGWFTPCHSISARGQLLLQYRVEPVRLEEMPKKVPKCIGDLKVKNFGRLKGRIVACDYGLAHNHLRAADRRLVKADWSDGG